MIELGFLDNGSGPKLAVNGAVPYQLMVAGDLPGAWTVLSEADLTSSPDILYNKAVCLRAAGRSQEALQFAGAAFLRLTEGVPQKPFDPVATALVSNLPGPVPMSPDMNRLNPTYAGILARWLYCMCLSDCGEYEQLSRIALPLERLGIKPVQETE